MVLKDKLLQNLYEIKIRVHLPDHNDEEKKSLRIRLFDTEKDLFDSKYLAEGIPEAYGFINLEYTVENQEKSPYSRLGDLFFVVIENDEIIYKSSTLSDLKSYRSLVDPSSSTDTSHVVSMGSFAVRR